MQFRKEYRITAIVGQWLWRCCVAGMMLSSHQCWSASIQRFNAGCGGVSFSSNDEFIVFSSSDSSLSDGQAASVCNIYRQHLKTGEIVLVSANANKVIGNDDSGATAISADGRYVAFESYASNLVPGDTSRNNLRSTDTYRTLDVFLKDLNTGLLKRVSKKSWRPSISPNGRHVFFISGDLNSFQEERGYAKFFFRKDMLTGIKERVFTSRKPVKNADYPNLSADGRYLVFESFTDNLVANDHNNSVDIFVKDLLTGKTKRISTTSQGEESNGSSFWPTISGDGHYAVFSSKATNLVVGDDNDLEDIFRKDLVTGEIRMVSADAAGVISNGSNFFPSISANGRYVTFESLAENFVTASTNNAVFDVFLKDMQTGTLSRISADDQGIAGNQGSSFPFISASGRYVSFFSGASDLVPGGTDRDSLGNYVYLYDVLGKPCDFSIGDASKSGISDC
ncbi:MAG: hypothetical protein ABL925_02965 [Methylococcales bacterium]